MSGETLKVLVVEDNPVDVLRLTSELGREVNRFEISHVESLSEARDILSREAFQLILLDLGLPDSYGIETQTEVSEPMSGDSHRHIVWNR